MIARCLLDRVKCKRGIMLKRDSYSVAMGQIPRSTERISSHSEILFYSGFYLDHKYPVL